jgi:hypothetical protein
MGMMVLLLIVVNPAAALRTVVSPTAPEVGTLPDWLTQGQLSIVESRRGRSVGCWQHPKNLLQCSIGASM